MGLVRVQGHSVIVRVSDCRVLGLPSGGLGVEELGGVFGSKQRLRTAEWREMGEDTHSSGGVGLSFVGESGGLWAVGGESSHDLSGIGYRSIGSRPFPGESSCGESQCSERVLHLEDN
jgi:hypothetical protein